MIDDLPRYRSRCSLKVSGLYTSIALYVVRGRMTSFFVGDNYVKMVYVPF